jgi:hypothetical protein
MGKHSRSEVESTKPKHDSYNFCHRRKLQQMGLVKAYRLNKGTAVKKGRIVQFGDGTYGYQRLLLGFIPVPAYLDLNPTSFYTYNWLSVQVYVHRDCKQKSLESLKEVLKKIENYKNPDKIVRVVKETELEKALE